MSNPDPEALENRGVQPIDLTGVQTVAGNLARFDATIDLVLLRDDHTRSPARPRTVFLNGGASARVESTDVEHPMPVIALDALFGHIDIYLFDQLLRGRVPPRARYLRRSAIRQSAPMV